MFHCCARGFDDIPRAPQCHVYRFRNKIIFTAAVMMTVYWRIATSKCVSRPQEYNTYIII